MSASETPPRPPGPKLQGGPPRPRRPRRRPPRWPPSGQDCCYSHGGPDGGRLSSGTAVVPDSGLLVLESGWNRSLSIIRTRPGPTRYATSTSSSRSRAQRARRSEISMVPGFRVLQGSWSSSGRQADLCYHMVPTPLGAGASGSEAGAPNRDILAAAGAEWRGEELW